MDPNIPARADAALDKIEPGIAIIALPAEEQVNAAHLCQCLKDLKNYEDYFAAALKLFDHSLENMRTQKDLTFMSWMGIAARDGAMSIYHFSKSLENAAALLGKCPTLLNFTDRSLLRSARKRLNATFSNLTEVRHAVAHAAELTMSPEKTRENAAAGPFNKHGLNIGAGVQVTIRNNLNGRLFQNTIDGKIQSYEISGVTLDALSGVRREYWSAFAKAAEITCARAREISAGKKKSGDPL